MKTVKRSLRSILMGGLAATSFAASATDGLLTADSYTIKTATTTLFNGKAVDLLVGGTSKAFVRFDLKTLPPNTEPSNVLRATAILWVNRVTKAGGVDLAPVTSTWNETTASSKIEPLVGATVATIPVTATGYVTVDVTAAVKDWLANPNSNLGIRIAPSTTSPATALALDSKENTIASRPARLDITLAQQGPQGPVGPQGPAGLPGEKGPEGDQGPQGPQGEQGPMGPAGPMGLTGATGPEGQKGDTGAPGEKGEPGPKGDPGAKGDTGPQGLDGAKGDLGISQPRVASRKWHVSNAGNKISVPGAGSLSFDGRNVWVGTSNNTLVQIDAATGETLKTCNTPNSPGGLLYDGIHFWVTNGSSSLVKLRASDCSVIGTYPAGSNPAPMAFDGASIWVNHGNENTISRLNTQTGELVSTVDACSGINAMTFDGRYLWVSCEFDSKLLQVDPFTAQIVATSQLSGLAYGSVFDGDSLWVLNNQHATKISIANGDVLADYAAGFGAGFVVSDEKHLYINQYWDSKVKVFDKTSGALVKDVVVGPNPGPLVYDGVNVWVLCWGDGSIYKM